MLHVDRRLKRVARVMTVGFAVVWLLSALFGIINPRSGSANGPPHFGPSEVVLHSLFALAYACVLAMPPSYASHPAGWIVVLGVRALACLAFTVVALLYVWIVVGSVATALAAIGGLGIYVIPSAFSVYEMFYAFPHSDPVEQQL